MEKIFESYVAKNIQRYEGFKEFNVYIQHNRYYLLEKPNMFKLRPDIVTEYEATIIILDTKWKLLSSDYSNFGISQSDLYQMYAYVKKYKSKNIILLYPKSNLIDDINKEELCFFYEDDIKVRIFFVHLENTEESINNLAAIVLNLLKVDEV